MRMHAVALVVLVLVAAGCTPNVYEVRTDKALFLDGRPGQKVYLKVTNTSLLTTFPLAESVSAKLKEKGYVLVDTPEAADYVLRANVTYSGLMEGAVEGTGVAGGAAAGAVVGAGTGYATGGHSRGVVGGAVVGALAGAGLGYWLESENTKDTFVTTIEVRVEDKTRKQNHEVSVNARIREKGLTQDSAATRLLPQIASQIAGQF